MVSKLIDAYDAFMYWGSWLIFRMFVVSVVFALAFRVTQELFGL